MHDKMPKHEVSSKHFSIKEMFRKWVRIVYGSDSKDQILEI
jgi:hypothetical protein